MKLKKVMKYQKDIKRLRLFRIFWAKQKRCLSFSIEPRLFLYVNLDFPDDKILTIFGLRIHYKKGGTFVL